MKKYFSSSEQGFTLIELLIVIVIIGALAVVVFVALNPVKRLQDARNARRLTDADSIRTAINEYLVDKGGFPAGLTAGMPETQIGTSNGTGTSGNPSCVITTVGCNVTGTACVDLSGPLASYLTSVPVDSLIGSASATGYSVRIAGNNIITVNACGTEIPPPTSSPVFDASSNPCPGGSSGYCANVSSQSWSHTTGNQNNKLLVVTVQTDTNPTAPTVSSITYGGTALTKAGSQYGKENGTVNEGNAEIWYLVNPASGTNTITVTLTGTATDFMAAAITFSNVNQSNPIGTVASTNNNNNPVTPMTVVTGTTANQMVVDSIAENNGTLYVNGSQTQVVNAVGTRMRGATSYRISVAGNTTMSWTPGSSDTYGMIVVSVN